MKKTLIALLALGSVAMAVETIDGNKFNADLAYRLNEDSYTSGPVVLTFKINEISGFKGQQGFITFGTDDKALKAWSQQSTYVGLTTGTDVGSTWMPSTNSAGTNSATLNGATNCWISKDATGANAAPGVDNSVWTVFYNGDNTTELTVVFKDGAADAVVEYITIENYAFDLNQFSVEGDKLAKISGATVTYNGKTHDLMTPEPATATLSLLALAGLAARRRRH